MFLNVCKWYYTVHIILQLAFFTQHLYLRLIHADKGSTDLFILTAV